MSAPDSKRPDFDEMAAKFSGMVHPAFLDKFRDLLALVYDRGHLHGEMYEFNRARAAIFGISEPATDAEGSAP